MVISAAAALVAFGTQQVQAQKKYAPGVTDTEITLGQTVPLSGPAAGYATVGKAMLAYFEMINAEGGVNGRRIKLVQLDDGYSPPKSLEQTRRLIERENVAFVVAPIGTPTALAVRKYLNDAKVPQLFIASGASIWDEESDKYPWSVGWQPVYTDEGRATARHILKTVPDAKVAALFQNDDSGKDAIRGLKAELAAAGKKLVAEESHEVSDPTVDSQIVSIKSSGANVFVMWGSPKATVQSLRKASDIDWHPQIYINQNSSSVPGVLAPVGLDKVKGVISAAFLKDPADAAWANDAGLATWTKFMDKYNAGAAKDYNAAYGSSIAQTAVQLLKQCGDDLSRENILLQSRRLNLELPMLLPGVSIKTSDSQRHPVRSLRMQQFDGKTWKVVPL
jgi:ABC-type branched-subunit amino acid transport system substrate-binding protein